MVLYFGSHSWEHAVLQGLCWVRRHGARGRRGHSGLGVIPPEELNRLDLL